MSKELLKKQQAILKLRKEFNAKYNRDVCISGGKGNGSAVRRFSTGSFWLDFACGGGIPSNRATAIVGEQSTSKTTIALKVAADSQKRDKLTHEYFENEKLLNDGYIYDDDSGCYVHEKKGTLVEPYRVAFVDLEGTYDADWFEALGGKSDLIEYVRPDYGEQAVDIIQGLINSKIINMIIIDSFAAMVPIKEISTSAEDDHMGLQARLINSACRKWVADINKIDVFENRPTMITINQMRQKIGIAYGSPDVAPGGLGQKFLASLEMRTRKGKVVTLDGTNKYPLWAEMKGVISKNKTAPPKIEYAFNLAVNDYVVPKGLDELDEDELSQLSDEQKEEIKKNDKNKKYPVSFKKGDILEHVDVIKHATQYNLIGKKDKSFFVQPIGEEAVLYNRKADLLKEWIYENEFKYNRIKNDLLKILAGRA